LTAILLVAAHVGARQIVAKNIVSKTYINITKDVLKKFGINVKMIKKNNDLICEILSNITTNSNTINRNIDVETDWSAATYFLALERIFDVNFDMKLSKNSSPGDAKFVEILDKIYSFHDKKNTLILDMKSMPDAALTAMVACALQNFTTKITGLETLKNKECDRLKAMHDEFEKCGIKTEISQNYDAITIYGKGIFELQNTVKISTYNDHRIAMCFAILGTKIGNLEIENPGVVKKSFPNFWQELDKCYE
jgi:3-phosphoshikimate 1-carboxyvinyltransferase